MEPTPDKPRTQGRPVIVCAVLLAMFGVMSYSAILQKCTTFDEPEHVMGGYLIRWFGDYHLNTEDPALFGLLTTIPQKQSDLAIKGDDPRLLEILKNRFKQWPYSVQILFRTIQPEPDSLGNPMVYDGAAYINRSRAVFTCIGVMLGALLAWWSYKLGGAKAAIIATLLFVFDPNFLAHSSIVKSDVPMALLMLWLMYSIWSFGNRTTWLNLLNIVLACAIAVNIKFSGTLFGMLVLATLGIRVMMPTQWRVFGREMNARLPRIALILSVCVFTFLFCWGAIWGLYDFRYSVTPDPSVHFDRAELVYYIELQEAREKRAASGQSSGNPDVQPLPPNSFVRTMVWIDDHHLLPEAWTNGLMYTFESTRIRATYLLGKISIVGAWYYFPCAMLFKTPLAVLILAAILLGRGSRRAFRKATLSDNPWNPRWTMICLWLPIAIYGIAAMGSNLAIGVRHVLPIYPFIYLLMAIALARWIELRGRKIVILTIVLMLGLVTESVLAWPNYIPFFNIACGGARGGIRLLGDSNLDWGQDLPALAEWQKAHPNVPLYLIYFGIADPTFYGINYINVEGGYMYSPLPLHPMDQPGVVAISANNLQGIYFEGEKRAWLQAFQKRTPLAVLGGSIYLYEWTAADAAAVRAKADAASQP